VGLLVGVIYNGHVRRRSFISISRNLHRFVANLPVLLNAFVITNCAISILFCNRSAIICLVYLKFQSKKLVRLLSTGLRVSVLILKTLLLSSNDIFINQDLSQTGVNDVLDQSTVITTDGLQIDTGSG